MKKCLIVCLLVLSIVSIMIPVGAASENAVFDIRTPAELPKTGDEFEVAVELTNNPGFCAIEFVLTYDANAMECVDAVTDDVLAGSLSVTNPEADEGAIVVAASLKRLEGDGTLALYYFKANQDITAFDFKLKDIILVDENNGNIEYEVAGGKEAENTPVIPDDTNDSGEAEDKPEEILPDSPVIDTPPYNDDFSKEEAESVPPVSEPDSEGETEEEGAEHTFPDVVGHWAEKYVSEAVKHGLFMGDTEGNFNPDDNVTRAQFVTVLWRMAGRPDVSTKLPFADIEDQIPEFKKAITWGYANGYIKGTSDTTFEPSATLTREAGMKILHSYSGGKIGKEIQLYAVYDGIFKDSKEISDWAKNSLYWGVYNKMISGTSSDTLSPKGTATRAQLAKILVDYLNIN